MTRGKLAAVAVIWAVLMLALMAADFWYGLQQFGLIK